MLTVAFDAVIFFCGLLFLRKFFPDLHPYLVLLIVFAVTLPLHIAFERLQADKSD